MGAGPGHRDAGGETPAVGGWRKVSYAADVGEDDCCSLCGEDYTECPCPGPTMDGMEYEWRDGELWAREEEDA